MIAKLHTAKDDHGSTSYVVEVRPRQFPLAHSTWFDAHNERLRRDGDGALHGIASGTRYLLCDDLLPAWSK